MSAINFVKAVASGNDFIIVDHFRKQRVEAVPISKLAQTLCRRKLSVGADGLLLIEPSQKCDFKMRIFNPDGTEVDMCGNGSRCLALYAHRNKIAADSKMVIETRAGNLEAQVKQDTVKIKMSRPKDLRLKFDLDINGRRQNLNYINTGVPHVVCFVQGLEQFAVEETGRAIRYHSEFQPEGTNADFVEVLDKDHIKLRTYERGVEAETLSCGTGAVAASIITTYEMHQAPEGKFKIKVNTRSRDTLNVYFNIQKELINDVYLEAEAKLVYRGEALV